VVQVNSDTAIQIKINRGYFFVLNHILLKREFRRLNPRFRFIEQSSSSEV